MSTDPPPPPFGYHSLVTEPAAVYRQRRERSAAEEGRLARRAAALSWARLAVALAVLFLLGLLLFTAAAPPLWLFPCLAAGVALFVALVVVHEGVHRRHRRAAETVAMQDDGLARLDRRWADLPPPPPLPAGADERQRATARDLALFGPASLARLLSTARTPAGRQTVARWLLRPADHDVARRRQPAVVELAADLELRQELELAGRLAAAEPAAGGGEARTAAFLEWAEGEPWLLRRPALVWTARLLPPLTVALAVLAVAGVVPAALPGLALVVNLALSYAFQKRLYGVMDRADAGAAELAATAGALEVLAGRRFEAAALRELAADLTAGDGALPAAVWMRRLARRVQIADARHGSYHVLAQVLTLWDFHALWLLERWQAAAGGRVRRWLSALGEMEALAALAALAHDQPSWAFPVLAVDRPARLDGRDLGHPLIADGERVGNDVRVGPPGTFLLVTGSNMSGKSTLLRALGLNTVLGQAGGPVCAVELRLPPLALGTSVLVEDSLADGVSFFMAELLRLKQVVAAAREARAEGRTLLYLLDEVLRGTNSRERRIAVTRVIGHLLELGAVGAVSTHDLELGEVEELARAAQQVHFREQVHGAAAGGDDGAGSGDGSVMTFDYRLRPGPAPTTNALALMAAIGLGEEGLA